MTAYGMSKAANLHFARELAERWAGRVTVNAVHPGMVRTTLIQEAPLPIRLVFAIAAASPEKGADTPVWLALDPALEGRTGGFYIKRKATAFPAPTDDEQARARLWAESERLVGLA
jgi:NAD(P)-dependent dehydrogenase (short-subunit alcohol dehydrogenase family)